MALWYEDKIEGCSCSNSNRGWCRKVVSEFLGTFVFVFISCATVANVNFYTSNGIQNIDDDKTDEIYYVPGSILYINLGIAFGYTLGLYISIENDGYLNLALTLIFRIMDKMKNKDVIFLIIAQFVGTFIAALLAWSIYSDKLNGFNDIKTGLIFCSGVNGDNRGLASLDMFVKSTLFTIGVMAIVDVGKTERKDEPLKTIKPPKSLEPLMIGLVLFVVGIAFSYRAPFYFNPLQDLAGRFVASSAGCENLCTYNNPTWWSAIPVFIPVLGSITGAFIYIFFIENNHQKTSNESERDEEMLGFDSFYGSTSAITE